MTITEPIDSMTHSCVAAAIKGILTTHREDWGIGSYEYAGAHGVDQQLVAVINEQVVWVDATPMLSRWTSGGIVEGLPDVKSWLDTEDGYVEFEAHNAGRFKHEKGVMLVEYEIS